MDATGEDIPAPQPVVSSLAPVQPRAARSPGWVFVLEQQQGRDGGNGDVHQAPRWETARTEGGARLLRMSSTTPIPSFPGC